MKKKYYIGLLLFLTACQNAPIKQQSWLPEKDRPKPFKAQGRVAISHNTNSGIGGFSWGYFTNGQKITLKAPIIGTTLGEVCQDTTGVFSTPVTGSQEVINLTKPILQNLATWTMGYYNPQLPYKILDNDVLAQSGWKIQRQVRTDGVIYKLILKNNDTNIRLVFDQFEWLPENNASVICHH